MSKKRQYKSYSQEFKEEAVTLVTEQGYSVADAAESLGIRTNQLYGWKKKQEETQGDSLLSTDERAELIKLRKENKQLRIFPVRVSCQVMQVSHAAYYAWVKRPSQVITAEELHLYRRIKQLFKASRGSLGSREMAKKLRKEGIAIGRDRVRTLMKQLKLKVVQRQAYLAA